MAEFQCVRVRILYNLLCYLYIGNLARLNAHDFALQYNSLLKAHKFPIEVGLSSVPDQEPLYDVINLKQYDIFHQSAR